MLNFTVAPIGAPTVIKDLFPYLRSQNMYSQNVIALQLAWHPACRHRRSVHDERVSTCGPGQRGLLPLPSRAYYDQIPAWLLHTQRACTAHHVSADRLPQQTQEILDQTLLAIRHPWRKPTAGQHIRCDKSTHHPGDDCLLAWQ